MNKLAAPPPPAHSHNQVLDEHEREQAEEHQAIRALVIHEVLREEGESELARTVGSLAWSGLAAGMSMGFSFLALALMQSALPAAPRRARSRPSCRCWSGVTSRPCAPR